MNSISISAIDAASPQYQAVWDLREEVLRKPIGLSLRNEDLSQDFQDTIIVAENDGTVIGCLMLQRITDNEVKLRQMAVYDEWQGKGVGKELVIAAEQASARQGYKKIVLHARKVAVGFYKALGYQLTSGEFTEVGIPHFVMEKRL